MNKNIFYLIVIIFFLNSCQSVRDGLTGAKRNQSDEFLVEKKNPLTLPPEFENLPVPIENSNEEEVVDEKDFDIRKLLGNLPKDESEKSGSNGLSESLESSILKKINKN
tara:strand:- start:4011 stop:4337 length:327 start_codon:yes stop_codon:yes gene_type:complete